MRSVSIPILGLVFVLAFTASGCGSTAAIPGPETSESSSEGPQTDSATGPVGTASATTTTDDATTQDTTIGPFPMDSTTTGDTATDSTTTGDTNPVCVEYSAHAVACTGLRRHAEFWLDQCSTVLGAADVQCADAAMAAYACLNSLPCARFNSEEPTQCDPLLATRSELCDSGFGTDSGTSGDSGTDSGTSGDTGSDTRSP